MSDPAIHGPTWIYLYKLLFGVFGMVDADVPALFVVNNVDTVTRGHSHKLFVQQSRIDARKYFFFKSRYTELE